MNAVYVSIEKNIDGFEFYKILWESRGITGVMATTMTEGIQTAITIEKSKTEYLYFVDIVADDIDFIPQLAILAEEINAPILIATSKEHYTEAEHHEAMDNGAHFYAPYCDEPEMNINGVLAAIKSYERAKDRPVKTNILTNNGILLSLPKRKAYVGDLEVNLTKTEFNLIRYFMENRGKALAYGQIYREVWEAEYNESFLESIKSAVKKLRKKISDRDNKIIENVRMYGYKMP